MAVKNITLHQKQYEALSFKTQYCAAIAGVRGGKTFVGSYWAGMKIAEQKGHGIICAPTYKMLQQATLPTFFEQFPEYRKYYKEQKQAIEFPNGKNVYIRSAEDPLSMEGITADWAWADEAGLFTVLAWTVLRSRTSLTRGQILLTTTPYNMGWLYLDFYKPAIEKRDPDLTVVAWASVDNPYFPKDFYEKEKTRLSPEEFARRYEGRFQKMQGLVYDFPDSQIIAPIEGLIMKADARFAGLDWGFRNAAAIPVIYRYDNAFYVVDEWKRTEHVTSEILQQAKVMMKDHKLSRFYPDPAEPDRLEEARRDGIPVYPVSKDITAGVNFVKGLIHEKRLFIYNTCVFTLDEINQYHYPEPKPNQEGKAPKEDPEKINDHLMDAMRYALYSHPRAGIIYTASKVAPSFYPEIGL